MNCIDKTMKLLVLSQPFYGNIHRNNKKFIAMRRVEVPMEKIAIRGESPKYNSSPVTVGW